MLEDSQYPTPIDKLEVKMRNYMNDNPSPRLLPTMTTTGASPATMDKGHGTIMKEETGIIMMEDIEESRAVEDEETIAEEVHIMDEAVAGDMKIVEGTATQTPTNNTPIKETKTTGTTSTTANRHT